MLSRLRQPLHYTSLARALFSTETQGSWTIHQAAAAGSAETVHILTLPDGKVTADTGSHQNNISPAASSSSSSTKSTTNRWHDLVTHQLQSTFLPTGYPHTVAPNYLKYVSWQALHHTAGAANGVLASTFLLYSVGLGAGAIPTAGALSWILKDGLGQLGTLLFGRAMAHNFDLSSRSWYVAASAKLNLAMSLEIATALAPQWFLPLGATANAVKGLAWMAGGSSRSAFNVAFAKDRNIADITAKATSQTICTSLLGTAAGMAIAASIEQSVGLCFTWYSVLAAVHMYSAVESAKSVPLKTLNPSRLQKLAHLFLAVSEESTSTNNGTDSSTLIPKLLTPADLAVQDQIFPFLNKSLNLVVGTSLQKLATTSDPTTIAALLPLYKNKRYILVLDKDNKMHLVLHEEAQTVHAVTAVLQAILWNKKVKERRCQQNLEENMKQEAKETIDTAENLAPGMLDALKIAGWDVQGVVIEPQRRRAVW